MIQKFQLKNSKYLYFLNFFFIIFFILIFLSNAKGQASGLQKEYPSLKIGDPSAVVAGVGSLQITAAEFKFNYEFGPSFLKRAKDSKKRYLDVMIYEKLLALEGYANGLDSTPEVKRSLKEVMGDLITEELYKDRVMNKVSVSGREVKAAIIMDEQHLSLKWLYSESEERSAELKNRLNAGASFDSLFTQQINNGISREDRSLQTTLFKLKKKNPKLYGMIDTLMPGFVSNPLKGPDGWYIIKITDYRVNPRCGA